MILTHGVSNAPTRQACAMVLLHVHDYDHLLTVMSEGEFTFKIKSSNVKDMVSHVYAADR